MFKKLFKFLVAFKAVPKVLKVVLKGVAIAGLAFGAVKGVQALRDQDADLFLPARIKNIVE